MNRWILRLKIVNICVLTVVPQCGGVEGSEKDLTGDAVCDWDPAKLLETGRRGWGGDPAAADFFKKEKKKEQHKEIQKLKEKIQNRNGHAAHAVFLHLLFLLSGPPSFI